MQINEPPRQLHNKPEAAPGIPIITLIINPFMGDCKNCILAVYTVTHKGVMY